MAACFVLLAASPDLAGAASSVRTLFLTESVRPTQVRGPLAGPVQPHQMVAQQGEEEGFQLAVLAPRSAGIEAFVDPAGDATLRTWTQILRTEWVNVTRPSTGQGGRTGRFADPLPPQVGAVGTFGAGKTRATAGQWSSFVVLVSVPTTLAPGTYTGTVMVRDETGATLASQPYSVRVVQTKSENGAPDPAIAPHDARNFKVLFNFNPSWYRALAPAATAQEQYEQSYRTLWMLARHRSAPVHWQRAYPSADGTYSCAAASGYLKAYDDMPWWADGTPGAVPVAVMPNQAVARCDDNGFTIKDEASASTKFDDRIGDTTKSAWFVYRVAEQWRNSGVLDHRTYFLNPFDEPSPAQNASAVPQVNKLVHDYAPGAKVLGTTWPMAKSSKRMCSAKLGKRTCATRPGQQSSNGNLRDGAGGDDLDGWIVPFFRAWGFGVTPTQTKAGINRSREVNHRLAAIKKAGGEAWTYDLPLGTQRVPQLAIDGPATDQRLMLWASARENYDGWFIAVSNRWVDPVNTTQSRNPWNSPLSWVGRAIDDKENPGPHGVVSNGWGSLYYPAVRPELGLTDPLAQPVASIRLERMRDGVEDANLMRQYRARFGQAALAKRLAGVLGAPRSIAQLPSRETFPSYSNKGLALRMEIVRRQLIAELAV